MTVKKKFGVFGDAYVHVTKGTGPELPEGAGLVATREVDIVAVVLDLINQVRDATLVLLESATKEVDEIVGLTADMRASDSPLQKSLLHLESIIQQIEEGKGPVGRFVTDEETAESLDQIIAEFTKVAGDIQKILEDVRQVTATLPEMARVVSDEVQDIPGTVAITQETIRETERLIVGVQNHWLLKKYVPRDNARALIPVYDIPRRPPGYQSEEESVKEIHP